MKKKILSLLVALCMVISTIPATAIAAYQDTENHWAKDAIEYWSNYGIIQGSEGRFDPDGVLTRAQMAAILNRLLDLPAAGSYGFADVKDSDWFAADVNACAAAGIMLGDNGYARPNEPVSRQQAVVMLARALRIRPVENPDLSAYTDAAEAADYAVGYLAALAEMGIVKGTSATTLSPNASISRAASVTILYRAIGIYAAESGEVDAADAEGIILVVADGVELVNVPAGTVVVIADGAEDTTVNGVAVEDGQAYEVPEKEEEPGTSSSGRPVINPVVPHEHYYSVWETTAEPDCYNEGSEIGTCRCGDTVTRVIPVMSHNWNEGVVTAEATCTQNGIVTYSCGRDGCGATRTVTVEMLDHDMVIDESQTTGCGSTIYICSYGCGVSEVRTDDSACRFGDWVQVDDIYHERSCAGCEFVETATHTFGEWVPNDDGSATHEHSCEVCGRTPAPAAHTYGPMELVDEKTGEFTCTACGDSYTESFVARIENSYYAALADAVEGASAGDVILMLDDESAEEEIAVGEDITIDLGSCSVAAPLTYASVDDILLMGSGDAAVIADGKTVLFEEPAADELWVVMAAYASVGDDTYRVIDVYTAEGLVWVGELDANGDLKHTEVGGRVISIMQDIDMAGYDFISLNGHFLTVDGKGNTISNLNCLQGVSGKSGLISYLGGGEVKDLTLKNVTASGCQVGAFAGLSEGGKLTNCRLEGTVEIVWEQNTTSDYAETWIGIGALVGYNSGIVITDVTVDGDAEITLDLSAVDAASVDSALSAGFLYVGFGGAASGYTDEGASITIIGVSVPLYFSGEMTVALKDCTIVAPDGVSAVTLAEGSDVELTVLGNVSLTGGKNGDGITVPASSELTVTGSGSLTVIGNAGKEYSSVNEAYQNTDDASFELTGGSGIGNAGGSVGTITIAGLGSLTAEGYGLHAFGIGGAVDGAITISDTLIPYVRGGFAEDDCVADAKYGKSEAEGGAAIGVCGDEVRTVTLTDVEITKAEGGSKAAAIGAQYHSGVNIVIDDCTVTEAIGGNASAAIGGSRAETADAVDPDDTVTITITDSVINAVGGYFGAGIGSGYDTHCSANQYACVINISDSDITAQGGKYAAGIGSGYHHANISGTISKTKIDAASGEKFYKSSYTEAQDVGFGVVDPAREGLENTNYLDVNGTKVYLMLPTAYSGLAKSADASKPSYYVSSAEGLAGMNAMLQDKTAGCGTVINLTCDIDFKGYSWTPVDSHADTATWVSEINGNGHTISNLTINGQAMFTRFAGSGDVVIRDITFDRAVVNSTQLNTSILTVQTYQNLLLDNVDVINSKITGTYKVAPLVATVYNESTSTITMTLKDCDVTDTVVTATSYDFCTAGMVAFVYEADNDKIEFENCTVTDVQLYAPNAYTAHAAVYTAGSDVLYNEVEGVTVTNVTFENI